MGVWLLHMSLSMFGDTTPSRDSPSSSISRGEQSHSANVPLKKRHSLKLSAFASAILMHVTSSACASEDENLSTNSGSLSTVELQNDIQDDSSVSARTESISAFSNKRPRSEMTFHTNISDPRHTR